MANYTFEQMLSKKKKRALKRKIRTYLLNQSSPRLQAFIILVFLGFNTFGASSFLAWLGMESMPLRYFLVTTYGYILFFVALHWLIKYHLYRERFNQDLENKVEEYLDNEAEFDLDISMDSDGSSSSSIWDSFSFDFDLDELAVLIIPLILIVGSVCFSLYFIYVAPVFIAEVLLEAVIMAYVLKKVKKLQVNHWSIALQKKTFWVYLIIVAILTSAGWLLQNIYPQVVTLGDVFR